jgi:hypothetical protein
MTWLLQVLLKWGFLLEQSPLLLLLLLMMMMMMTAVPLLLRPLLLSLPVAQYLVCARLAQVLPSLA